MLKYSFSSNYLLCVASVGITIGCGSSQNPITTAPHAAPTVAPVPSATAAKVIPVSLQSVGLDPDALDRRTDPCQDFYQFACGGWIAKTEIPADQSRWGRSFSEIQKRNEEDLKRILEAAARAPGDDPVLQKIGAYYGACMDERAVEADKTRPIDGLLAKARKITDAKSITALVAHLHRYSIWALFDIADTPDAKNATHVIAQLDQNGLGLPDRDYYLKEDDKSKEIRKAYVAHATRMMKLAGFSPTEAQRAATDVMNIETELAKVSKTRVERRDPKGTYNRIDRGGLTKAAPEFAWDVYFQELGHPSIQDITVTSIPFFEGLNKLLSSIKPSEWQSYFQWHIVHANAPILPKAFVDENFTLQAMLTGQKAQKTRWKRCVESTNEALGEALAQPYVKLRFSGDSKESAERMVLSISQAFHRELGTLDWMDPTTRARAAEKQQAMEYLMGYPDKWRIYGFAIDPKHYTMNALAAHEFENHHKLGKVGQPVDRKEWEMTPPTVNAYYEPTKNEMVFPAGILQPPFYSVSAGIPVNLGAIGMVVGHELTHGFDDEGSQFDSKGNLDNWWSPPVQDRFNQKTKCVAEQYSTYEPVAGVKVNGELTLGENIADMGGVKLAFSTYRDMRKSATEVTVADGFTEDQQFFLAVGQAWCSNVREEYTRMATRIDPHSPPKFRVNGPLSNLHEFAQSFSCPIGSPMHPTKTCSVW